MKGARAVVSSDVTFSGHLSVVVPTRDTSDLTVQCLAAVTQAAIGMWCEVILVDDGSRDGTADRVRVLFPDVRIMRHDESRGFTASANAGLREATGTVLLLLNSDTEVRAGSLHAVMDAFDRDAALGIAGAQLLNSDGTPQWSGGRRPDCWWLFAEASGIARRLACVPGYRRLRPLKRAKDRDVAWVSGAALAMRRTVWESIGPLDESFHLYGQDLDFCVRAGRAPWRIRILAGATVLHHQGATITRMTGTVNRHAITTLWTDLVSWSAKEGGTGDARRAALAIALGARLRLLGRWLMTPSVARARRQPWFDQSREISAALHALRGLPR